MNTKSTTCSRTSQENQRYEAHHGKDRHTHGCRSQEDEQLRNALHLKSILIQMNSFDDFTLSHAVLTHLTSASTRCIAEEGGGLLVKVGCNEGV